MSRKGVELDSMGEPNRKMSYRESVEHNKEAFSNRRRSSSVDVIVKAKQMNEAQQKKKAGAKTSDEEEDLTKAYTTDAHRHTLSELEQVYNTDLQGGLTDASAAEALERHGLNQLTPPPKTHPLILLLKAIFLGAFNILLWMAVFASIGLYIWNPEEATDLYVGLVLAFVVVSAGFFAWYQQATSESLMDSFENFLPDTVNVIRNGIATQVESKLLVPGDVIDLKFGDKLPADIRIIECSTDLAVDNSSLTGESDPCKRAVDMSDENVMETKNLAFFGTLVLKGKGRAVVINTGDRTLMGRIAGLADQTESVETPIEKELHDFVKKIALIAIAIGVFFLAYDLITKVAMEKTLIFVIAIIVANIPEGLLPTVTLALTMSAQRMVPKNVLVKDLNSVETLGSCSVICSDKTGTLTTNIMTVAHVYYNMQAWETDTADPVNGKNNEFDVNDPGFKRILRIACLCNAAKYLKDGSISGDASETALLKFANPQLARDGGDILSYRGQHAEKHGIPFNSANKWQLSIHAQPESDQSRIVFKGAPERVLNLCDRYFHNGETLPLTPEIKKQIMDGVLALGAKGERVLGFADLELDGDRFPKSYEFSGDGRDGANFPFMRDGEEGFVFVGLFALIDPPRPGVPEAVAKCQTAGIKVIMVTGDHPVTAEAIARKVGIIEGETAKNVADRTGRAVEDIQEHEFNAVIVSGSELESELNDYDDDHITRFWNRVLNKTCVSFARTSPQQKLLIVAAAQERGGIVAVTGDGVNDSPALKKADIGVAMGITGTDVAKDAADMILLDDNFASIVLGIEEGRIIFDNLKKSIAYTLCSKLPQLSPFLLHAAAAVPVAMTTMMVLLIDLGTDIWAAIALAHEAKEGDIMRRAPRHPTRDHLVGIEMLCFSYLQIGIIQMLGCFSAFFAIMYSFGYHPSELFGLDKQGSHFGNSNLPCNAKDESSSESQKYPATHANQIFVDASGSAHWPDKKNAEFAKNLTGTLATKAEGVDTVYVYQNSWLEGCNGNTAAGCGKVPAGETEYAFWQPPAQNGTGYLCLWEKSTKGTYETFYNCGRSCDQQAKDLRTAQTGFYASEILLQIMACLITKTRINSIVQQGLGNSFMNFNLILELVIGILIIYVPALQGVFGTEHLPVLHWFAVVPMLMFLMMYDEMRKFWIKTHRGGWVERHTFW